MSSNAYADRFLYTPSLGACLAIAYAIYLLAGMNRESSGATWSSKRILALGILALLVVAASVKTISYVPAWKNDMALFEYNLKVNPNNAFDGSCSSHGSFHIAEHVIVRSFVFFQLFLCGEKNP